MGASTRGLVAGPGPRVTVVLGKEFTAVAEVSPDLLLRQQERVLEELRLVRSDIGDFRVDMEGAPRSSGGWIRACRA